MVIEPAFDPRTRTWFVEQPCKCEGSTIRLLKRALRELYPTLRFEVPDYYVGNSPPTVWPKTEVEPTPLPVPQRPLKPMGRPPRLRSKYMSLYDSILDAWGLGFTQEKISAHFGVTKYAVQDILALGRSRKDPRAVLRKPGPPKENAA